MPETPAEQDFVRKNFGFDAFGSLGTGLFNALVISFLAVIARREGADTTLLAALAAAPYAANTLSIFTGFWVPTDRRRVRYGSMLLFGGRAIFLVSLLASGPVALVLMAFGTYLVMAVAAPLQVDIWRGAYPQRLRARVLGYLRVIQTLASAVGAPLGGLLLERLGSGPMLGIGAALGMLGATGVSRLHTSPVAASKRFTPAASLKLLVDEPRYRGLIIAWVVWGFGALISTPLYAVVLVDRFQASYSDIGYLQLVGALTGLLAYYVLGQQLDRRGGFGATPAGLLLVGVVPLIYLLAPSLPFLAIGYILLSVGTSASDLGWQVVLISKVSDEHRLRYQAAQTSLTGLRGVAAPFAGSLILSLGFGVGTALVVSGLLGIVGALMLARALGISLKPDLAGIRAIIRNRRRPRADLRVRHRVVRSLPRVQIAPAPNVRQVLLTREERPAADALARGGSAERRLEAPNELVHDPIWQPVALAGVDKAEQDKVRQQDAPVRAETAK